MIARVLAKTGEMVQTLGMMYKVVSQYVLLYSIESWVMTRAMLKVLEGFHLRAARHIMGMMATDGDGRDWEYTPVVVALEA